MGMSLRGELFIYLHKRTPFVCRYNFMVLSSLTKVVKNVRPAARAFSQERVCVLIKETKPSRQCFIPWSPCMSSVLPFLQSLWLYRGKTPAASHQHARCVTALDLAKWINLDLGCKWANGCVITDLRGHALRSVPFPRLLGTVCSMFCCVTVFWQDVFSGFLLHEKKSKLLLFKTGFTPSFPNKSYRFSDFRNISWWSIYN